MYQAKSCPNSSHASAWRLNQYRDPLNLIGDRLINVHTDNTIMIFWNLRLHCGIVLFLEPETTLWYRITLNCCKRTLSVL